MHVAVLTTSIIEIHDMLCMCTSIHSKHAQKGTAMVMTLTIKINIKLQQERRSVEKTCQGRGEF